MPVKKLKALDAALIRAAFDEAAHPTIAKYNAKVQSEREGNLRSQQGNAERMQRNAETLKKMRAKDSGTWRERYKKLNADYENGLISRDVYEHRLALLELEREDEEEMKRKSPRARDRKLLARALDGTCGRDAETLRSALELPCAKDVEGGGYVQDIEAQYQSMLRRGFRYDAAIDELYEKFDPNQVKIWMSQHGAIARAAKDSLAGLVDGFNISNPNVRKIVSLIAPRALDAESYPAENSFRCPECGKRVKRGEQIVCINTEKDIWKHKKCPQSTEGGEGYSKLKDADRKCAECGADLDPDDQIRIGNKEFCSEECRDDYKRNKTRAKS